MGGQTTRQIQRQIKGTENVKQITHAMQLVSAAKLKRVEKKLESIRPYWGKVREIFGHLIHVLEESEDEEVEAAHLNEREEVDTIGIIVIAGEKGLCGGYNADVFEKADQFLSGLPEDAEKKFISIGTKTQKWLRKKPYETVETLTDLPTEPSFDLARKISTLAEDRFLDETFDEVHVVYTKFINALQQKPGVFQFLPVKPEEIIEEENKNQNTPSENNEEEAVSEYIFEPEPQELLEQFLPRFVNMLFYTLLLESLTSEHGARMVAMRDATDNAEDKIEDLTHTYNQARQESITRELLDIVGAVSAQEEE